MATQVTLVSFYGDKNSAFAGVITRLQQLASQAVGPAFAPYETGQVHATLLGLERHRAPRWNANFSKYQGRDVEMDFTGFLDYLRGCNEIPFKVQVGGFAKRDYPFTSRNATPYERSFSVQGDKVVMMGWPVTSELSLGLPATTDAARHKDELYPPTLDRIRRAAQRFGILHAFHRTANDVDNDLYFRIGLVDSNATTPAAICALEIQARQLLSMQPPLVFEIRLEDIYIAAYEDYRLPISSTRVWSLADPKVTGSFVAGLFEQNNRGPGARWR